MYMHELNLKKKKLQKLNYILKFKLWII